MSLRIEDNADLGACTTFRVPARARRLIDVDEAESLARALEACGGEPPFVLGGGSNLLLTRDLDRPVLRWGARGTRVLREDGDDALIEVEGGEDWPGFVRWTLDQGWFGLENLSLIPGRVGASPIQNIGAYGVEMRERFAGLDAFDLQKGTRHTFDADACLFGYRDSLFKRAGGSRWLVLRVRYLLSRRPSLRLDYGELRTELASAGHADPGPREVADAVCRIRRARLPDPALIGNAGSFFKNPVVSPAVADTLGETEPDLPRHPSAAGVKLSAAWMIDRCGWRGHRDGDAGVHDRHALVLVNHGNATGEQLLRLATRIVESVQARFDVRLEPEPVIL